ncbi:hypothetical protein CDAR_311631 [Caerostris darwini]|uniref:Uncharacterized protein n=1 Tax=Caerostris darwini TaxID=1538125 RepID=A0AAV4UTF2_9ARAC|nr:hypothetical protein CDAR_311631 [Caerostris darwini]
MKSSGIASSGMKCPNIQNMSHAVITWLTLFRLFGDVSGEYLRSRFFTDRKSFQKGGHVIIIGGGARHNVPELCVNSHSRPSTVIRGRRRDWGPCWALLFLSGPSRIYTRVSVSVLVLFQSPPTFGR